MNKIMEVTFCILALSLMIIIYSCKSDVLTNNSDLIEQIEGSYQGVYSITHNFNTDSVYTLQGNINFEFSKRTYKCIGEKYLLPPDGIGTYKIDYHYITLTDTVGHSAEFDWTLIIQGQFDYSFDGKNLIMEQNDIKHKRFHKLILSK